MENLVVQQTYCVSDLWRTDKETSNTPDVQTRAQCNIHYSPNSTSCVTSRHDTLSRPCILAQEKLVTCCVTLVGQHGATCSSREARLAWNGFRGVAKAWTGVDMSTSFFQKLFRAQKTKLEHASSTASSSSAMLEQARPQHARQARLARHDARDMNDTSRHDKWRVSCRDVTQQVEFGLILRRVWLSSQSALTYEAVSSMRITRLGVTIATAADASPKRKRGVSGARVANRAFLHTTVMPTSCNDSFATVILKSSWTPPFP